MVPSIVVANRRSRPPRIQPLDQRQVEYVLARNSVARIAFVIEGRAELFPVHYVYSGGAIYGRIAAGKKYFAWLVLNDIVLEVDEVKATFEWRSVIVRGTITLLHPTGKPADRAAYDRAVTAIRTLIPTAFTEGDPTPDREFVFRIDPTEMTGKAATAR